MLTMKQVREIVECQLQYGSVVSAWIGYGEPLFLKFTRAPQPQSFTPNSDTAYCKLKTNFATWSVEGPIIGNQERDDRAHLESVCQSLLDAVVQEVEVAEDGRLTLRFDGCRVLKVVPWPVDDGLSDAWCMTLKIDKILAVSNSGRVAIVDNHLPIRDWFK